MTEAKRVVLGSAETAIHDELMDQARLVDRALAKAADALQHRDLDLARTVVAEDAAINELRRHIERRCLVAIASQQPVARDLRAILAAMHITAELERMGDHARSIARLLTELYAPAPEAHVEQLVDMAAACSAMIHRVMGSYNDLDATTAERVAAEDDTVDAMARELVHRVLADISTSATEAGCGARLLWMSRSLERIADHVTNIAERVVFMVTGQTKELG
jgi:phosphate transport system protein